MEPVAERLAAWACVLLLGGAGVGVGVIFGTTAGGNPFGSPGQFGNLISVSLLPARFLAADRRSCCSFRLSGIHRARPSGYDSNRRTHGWKSHSKASVSAYTDPIGHGGSLRRSSTFASHCVAGHRFSSHFTFDRHMRCCGRRVTDASLNVIEGDLVGSAEAEGRSDAALGRRRTGGWRFLGA
jgi:hypothetical protein